MGCAEADEVAFQTFINDTYVTGHKWQDVEDEILRCQGWSFDRAYEFGPEDPAASVGHYVLQFHIVNYNGTHLHSKVLKNSCMTLTSFWTRDSEPRHAHMQYRLLCALYEAQQRV